MGKKAILEHTKQEIEKDEKKLIAEVLDRFILAEKAQKKALDRVGVDINSLVAYYKGQQLPANATEYDIVYNNITPIIQSGIATLMSTPLNIEFIPSSEDEREIVKTFEDSHNFYWKHRLNMKSKIESLLTLLKVKGTAFLYPHLIMKNDMPELAVDVISPECIFPDPTAKDDEDCEFVFYSSAMSLKNIIRNYPLKGWKVQPEAVAKSTVSPITYYSYSRQIELIQGAQTQTFMSPVDKGSSVDTIGIPQAKLIIGFLKDDTIEEEVLCQYKLSPCIHCQKNGYVEDDVKAKNVVCPNCGKIVATNILVKDNKSIRTISKKKYPRGRMITIANNILLEDRPNPYYDFPFIRFRNIDSLDYWGISDVEMLFANQVNINRLLSALNLLIALANNAPVVADKNIEVPAFVKPGARIARNPGEILDWMSAPPIPPQAFDLIRLFILQMDNISGLMDRTRAKTATESSLLDEAEQRRQTSILRHVATQLKRLVLHTTYILQHYHTYTEQLALDYKKDKYVLFKGASYERLMFDVSVQFSSDIPQSRTVRYAQIMQAYQAGLLSPEETRQQLDLPDLPNLEENKNTGELTPEILELLQKSIKKEG